MAAVRRRSGSGTIVALVIFIVVAFIAIGLSLWLYQQNAMARQAIQSNQKAFGEAVEQVFQQNGWTFDKNVSDPYGLEYAESIYNIAGEKLREAGEYESLKNPPAGAVGLGWAHADALRAAVKASPAQRDVTQQYETLQGLLRHYEKSYDDAKREVADLKTERDTAKKMLEDRTQDLSQLQQASALALQGAEKARKDAVQALQDRYAEMEKMYKSAREDVKNAEGKYDKDQADWKTESTKLQQEVKTWRELYDKLRAQEKGDKVAEETMSAAGKVLKVEPFHEFVVLAGGANRDRKASSVFVVYTESPTGECVPKGRVVVSEVGDVTSIATILSQDKRILEGDLFIGEEAWRRFMVEEKPAGSSPAATPAEPAATPAAAGAGEVGSATDSAMDS